MLLRLTKKEEIETLTKISIDAFHSDYLIGLDPNDGPPDYDNIEWHRKMQIEHHLYSYIDDNNRVIGGAILFPSNEILYIGRIFISSEFQRLGYGIKLMNDIEKMFDSIKLFKLDTPLNNVRTNNFYKKLGYIKTKTEYDCATYIKNKNYNEMDIIGDNYFGNYKIIRTASRGIIIDKDNILLSYSKNYDLYMIPGGGLESGEDIISCCIREIEEETGKIVQPSECKFVINEYYEDEKYVSYYFVCKIKKEGKIKLTENEIKSRLEARWVNINQAIEILSKYGDCKQVDEIKRGVYLREFTALKYILPKDL